MVCIDHFKLHEELIRVLVNRAKWSLKLAIKEILGIQEYISSIAIVDAWPPF